MKQEERRDADGESKLCLHISHFEKRVKRTMKSKYDSFELTLLPHNRHLTVRRERQREGGGGGKECNCLNAQWQVEEEMCHPHHSVERTDAPLIARVKQRQHTHQHKRKACISYRFTSS